MAEAHGGTIVLNSPEEAGSEFVFTLPIVKAKTASRTKTQKEAREKYSSELRKSLSHLIPRLSQLNYYQTSEIYSLLSSVSFKASDRKMEFEELKKKALSCNPEYYSELINQLS